MGNSNWAEVIRFYATMTNATPFVERAVKTREKEQLELAYQIVTEGSKVGESVRSQ